MNKKFIIWASSFLMIIALVLMMNQKFTASHL